MAKVKTIQNYRTVEHGYTTELIPIADKESQVIMELNFQQFISELADILVEYVASENFKAGQIKVLYLYLQYIANCFNLCHSYT